MILVRYMHSYTINGYHKQNLGIIYRLYVGTILLQGALGYLYRKPS